jgi:hypothetical protein
VSRGQGYNDWERSRYARRVASGACVSCGGERADGDARLCSRCRERHRETCRRTRTTTRGLGSAVRRHERTVADVGEPVRRLITCHRCYDMAWRRPQRSPCPECGGRYGPEDTREAAEVACHRESVGPW